MKDLKKRLDNEVINRNNTIEVSYNKPDPLLIANRYVDEYIILLCALFGYGKASLIVKFLDSLDFSLLQQSEEKIDNSLKGFYYRFQNSNDIKEIFKIFRRLKQKDSLNAMFLKGYKKENNILEGIDYLIKKIYEVSNYRSKGFTFLVSSPMKRDKNGLIKYIGNSTYKRWNMFLRWMVRKDFIDLGLWKGVDTSHLLIPLDTHTFKTSLKLGLLNRKIYDLQSVILITKQLREFDYKDPIKYDFALYRIGQEKIL